MPLPPSAYTSGIFKEGIFNDTVVFCTGGAGTICSAQVRALVHLGANACIVGRNAEKTEQAAKEIASIRSGAKVIGIGNVDVRKIESLSAAVERCVRELGGIDYTIAGAAGNFLAPLSQLSANAFKSVIEIDLIGSFNTFKVTAPHLVASAAKNKSLEEKYPSDPYSSRDTSPASHLSSSAAVARGRILFVSATLHYAGTPLQAHAMAAKAGVDALSSAVAIEYGPRGVTSNVIAPGPIAGTEGMGRLSKQGGSQGQQKGIPVQRWGEVREIADATVFLFSGASGFTTGEVLVVDGGQWRMGAAAAKQGFEYPDFLLSGDAVSGVKGLKSSKL